MRTLDKLVLKDLIGPFLNGLAMFILLVFTAAALFQATDFLVRGVPFPIVAKFVLYSMPGIVTQTFPMAMLLAGLLAFGRISADREAVAIFANGISFFRTARMVYIAGALVSVLAFYWNDWVVPAATVQMWEVKQQALQHLSNSEKSEQPLAFQIESKEGKGVEEFVTVDGGYDSKTRTLRRVSIVKYSDDPKRKGQPEVVAYCERATYAPKTQQWVYYNGSFTIYTPDPKTGQVEDVMPLAFEELTALPKGATVGKTFEEMVRGEINDANRRSFRDLQKEIEEDRKRGRETLARGKEVDLYGKIALPLASLIFGVVGSALGLNTQRGGGKTVGFGVAIFIVFLYWVFYHSTFVIGKNGGLPPMLASFMADIVGAVVGVILSIRASR